jgi:hypothetical protein
MFPRRGLALGLALSLSCASSPPKEPRALELGVVRYRLELRHNKVSPGDAFRCYSACQKEASPGGYVDCLSRCPGFETTQGVRCAKYEVPPVAACLTVRKIPKATEPPPGMVVLAIVGSFLLVVGASSLCAASSSPCGYYNQPPAFSGPY